MKLNKLTSRNLIKMVEYRGVCDGYGSPVEYDDEIIAIEIERTDNVSHVVPVDMFQCPGCSKVVSIMHIWKNMDISGELRQIKKNL